MSVFNQMIGITDKKNISLVGMTDEFFCLYIFNLFQETKQNIIIVTSTLYEANKLVNSLNSYTDKAYLFPMDDFLTSMSIAVSPELKITRLGTLNKLISGDKSIVVAHLESFIKYLPNKEEYKDNIIKISEGQTIDRDLFINKLYDIGYKREVTVSATGEVGIRGFVIDIFSVEADYPIRIEFFGDEIESIRIFDPANQKSIKKIKEADIFSNTEKSGEIDSNGLSTIIDYIRDPKVVVKDYTQLKLAYQKINEDLLEYQMRNLEKKDIPYFSDLSNIPRDAILYNTFDSKVLDFKDHKQVKFDVTKIEKFNENIEAINDYLTVQIKRNKTVIVCLTEKQINTFQKYVNINSVITTEDNIYDNRVNLINKHINAGFIYDRYVILTELELFNKKTSKNKYKTGYKYAAKIKNVSSLSIGDYVVHNAHGIGVYNGIKTLSKGLLKKDYLEVLYQGKDRLYIPVEKIELLSKYSGKEGLVPKINKLGSSEWAKTKLRVKKKVQEIASRLIKLYAERKMQQGFKFSADTELQELFESEFEYVLTPDQKIATNQIKKDMESSSPMDRLLCGDVGYGKTEVAFRAMFKAVCDSKQVLYLCPTTILSSQQYNNAKNRFKNFPVNMAVLNRFTPRKEIKKTLEDLKTGKLDILFGTHRILSKDIELKELGLLVVDEEQRFGVTHKERIKEYKNNVDVLTLTATPIPRTLQMSLIGIRGLSLIETPPVNRYPVETYVIEENSLLIKDAIYKELSRQGQVFLLFNRVEKIEQKAQEISNLVPDARVVFAHGRMNKDELEDIMIRFVNHEYDVLVCTTIIETGIDIPNVNTLIIINSDRFGLSQLYQIRGRVGRSDKIAYAYLMYNKNKVLTETAIKRLKVIKEFTELGSGLNIATRDLSIRGAGDILGSEQAGFIDNIGIDLYMKILNDEIKRIKGDFVEEEPAQDIKPLLEVDTHIEDKYVSEAELKIEIHQKINEINSFKKLESIKLELEDRFGKLDDKLILYMHEELFEKMAKDRGIEKVVTTRNTVELYFSKDSSQNIDGEKVFEAAFQVSNYFKFSLKNSRLIIALEINRLERHYLYYLIELLTVI